MESRQIPKDRGRGRYCAGLLNPPARGRAFRLYAFEYSAEPLIGFKDLQVIHAVPTGKGKEHERKNHPGISPPLSRSKGKMTVDASRKTQSKGKVEV
jgi:hypothetical protein